MKRRKKIRTSYWSFRKWWNGNRDEPKTINRRNLCFESLFRLYSTEAQNGHFRNSGKKEVKAFAIEKYWHSVIISCGFDDWRFLPKWNETVPQLRHNRRVRRMNCIYIKKPRRGRGFDSERSLRHQIILLSH